MKKLVILSLCFVGIAFAKAQDAKKVFSSNDVVWFGMDFTKAKFVGDFGQVGGAGSASGSDMRNRWIPDWNNLVVNEQPKFDIRKSFRKDNVFYDIATMNEINKKVDPDACMSPNPGKIEKSEIDAMVKNYKSDTKKDGLGLAFIIENFNKATQTADVYVTFFDIASKKVLVCEKVSAKGVGMGLRNYWAGSIKNVLKQVDENEYKNWKNKY